jgi:hypothetical protein
MQISRVQRRLRQVAFVGAALFMLLSPAYVQVFGGRRGVFRAWQMYHKRGIGLCAAIYDDRGTRIDRYRLFGLSRTDAPVEFRRISGEDEARAMGRRICERLPHDRGLVDVRVTLRCGVVDGLQTVLDRENNLCGD